MEDGSFVESSVIKAVIQGEARVGKTSFKCMLSNDKYTDNRSTNCIESPCVAIKCYGHTGKWEHYDEERMEVTVIAEIHSRAEKHAKESCSAVPKGKVKSITKQDHKKGSTTHSTPTKRGDALPAVTIELTTDRDHEDAVTRVHKFWEKCKTGKKEGASFLDGRKWLYFIDSGGQIQFQKLLPAFMPYSSVLIVVVSLSKDLSEPASTIMQLPDRKITVGERSISVIEILKQLLSAVASSAQQYRSLIAEDPILSQCITPPSDKLKVLPVATHRDEYDEAVKNGKESDDDKVTKLNDILNRHTSTCEVIRQKEKFHLYEIDGRKAQERVTGEEVDPNLEVIAEALEDNAYKIKVPLKWYCYGVLLDDVAKEGCGVLSLSYCQELGQQLGLSPDESLSAIKFQSLLNKLLYFPDSPADDLVFVKLESLINILSDLVVFICDARSDLEAYTCDAKTLASGGVVSVDILNRVSKHYNGISKSFPEFNLLGLFKNLLIAAQLPGGQFLMPALLPIKEVSDINPFPTTIPLLLYFEKALPIGLFCAVIVRLLSCEDCPWTIDAQTNYSNYFKLHCTDFLEGSVVLVEQIDSIVLYCESHDDYIYARNAVEEAVSVAMSKHKLSPHDKPRRAFYCPCKEGGRHVAIAKWFVRGHRYFIRCTHGVFKVESEEFHSWLGQTSKLILCNKNITDPFYR